MAQRGRKPKPTALKLLEGNAGKRPINENEPRPLMVAPPCPSWLLGEARTEWERMARQLEDLGLLTAVDMAAFPVIVKTLIDNLPQIIKAGLEIVVALVKGIVDATGRLISAAGEIAMNFLRGLWEGIKNGASWLWGKIKGWIDGLISDIKGVFGIHSPSRVFADIGKNLVAGMAGGITGNLPLVSGAMDKLNAVVGDAKADIAIGGGMGGGGNVVHLQVVANTLDEGQINRLVNIINRRLGLACRV